MNHKLLFNTVNTFWDEKIIPVLTRVIRPHIKKAMIILIKVENIANLHLRLSKEMWQII